MWVRIKGPDKRVECCITSMAVTRKTSEPVTKARPVLTKKAIASNKKAASDVSTRMDQAKSTANIKYVMEDRGLDYLIKSSNWS